MESVKKKALTDGRSCRSGRRSSLTPAQPMAFVEYLHTLPQAHFTRPQMAQMLFEQTGFRWASHYLPVVLRAMGLVCYKPRPTDLRRVPEAAQNLIERLRATFDGLQTMGCDLNRVALGVADEASPQLSANTARLWSLGDAPRLVNTAKERANTFGFLALQGCDYCQPLANSCAESFINLLPKGRAANQAYDALVLLWDNLPAHKTREVEAAARRHQIFLVNNIAYSPELNPIEGIWKQIKRRISERGLIESVAQLKDLVEKWFHELTATTSLARSWLEQILLKALPPKSAISFCQPFS